MRLFYASLIVLLSLIYSTSNASEPGLFVAEVIAEDQSESLRNSLLPNALQQVLIKSSGDVNLAKDPKVKLILSQAPQLLQSFSYKQRIAYNTKGIAEQHQYLIAQFEPSSIERILSSLGRNLWSERPTVLIWLVIADGPNKRIANADEISALWALTETAKKRGVSLAFPEVDAKDLALTNADSLWAGTSATVMRTASRYNASVVMIIRLSQQSGAWSANYTMTDGGKPQNWSGQYTDANTALAAAGNDLSDRLEHWYSLQKSEQTSVDYKIKINGINSIEDYNRALSYLTELSVIRKLEVIGAEGTQLNLNATLAVLPERFRMLLDLNKLLEFDQGALADPGVIALKIRSK